MNGGLMISIIVPVYNSKTYLKSCINSILANTYKDYELILVDDASNDGSEVLCDELSAQDIRIKVIHHESNKGLSLSKYDGYRISKGNWICFVDNDDIISSYMLEQMIDASKSHADAEIICVSGLDVNEKQIDQYVDKINNNTYVHSANTHIEKYDGINSCRAVYGSTDYSLKKNGIYSATWGKIIKRSLFENVLEKVSTYKDELFWVFLEDVLFIPICLKEASKVIIIDDIHYLHRISKANLSAKMKPTEYHYEVIKAQDLIQDYYRGNELKDVADEMLTGFMLMMQSVWYKIYGFEDNISKRKSGLKMLNDMWHKYIDAYKVVDRRSGNILHSISIFLFDKSKYIWRYTVGLYYFKIRR